jgi:host factor-I protein
MSEFNTGLPSIRQIQGFIKDKKEAEIKISTGDQLLGRIIWQDHDCVCLLDQSNQQVLIWRHALVYIKPKN